MSNLVKVNAEEFGVEKSRAEELTTGLIPHLQERENLISEFEQIKDLELTEENCEVFKKLRLKFRDNRTKGINVWHKKSKEIPLRMGQLIDAIKRSEVDVNETYESKLENGEKHFERLEAQRIESLREERWKKLSNYRDEEPSGLGTMETDVFEALLSGAKAAHEEVLRAEKEAEAARIAKEKEEAAERERIRLENEQLKKEREKLEAQAKAAEAARLKQQQEREAKEAKERAAYEAKLKAEREAREKLEAEAEKQKKEAEAKAKAEAEQKRAADLAPDKDKLRNLANKFMAVEIPVVTDEKAKKLLDNVVKLQSKISDYILTNVKEL